ncbi:saccharopine dehydrogenase NADP-binding domain-containing protein [Patescibacteria group bacterium]|nr:saccharopine dehydrogenase NADP-binding domain-containing protein [Patescibacteria group bacterium]MBU1703496.1 saccharopine dehydrogenase NADP-binding domain-containing protein [Patescibacteria group bacterium]MBU1953349.1 saccharopine dehydrogenase NADP-binding domain-containing protein [Patescibacteria group bacterium]
MGEKTLLILGGYGGTGRILSRLLLKETDARLIIAGRTIEKAEELADKLNRDFPGGRASARFADAADRRSLDYAFKGTHMVIVASTTTDYVAQVAAAALDANIDYLDYHYPQKIVPVLNGLAPEIEKKGRCFITQAGFHPGLPSVFVRYGVKNFDQYDKALIAMTMNAKFEKTESLYELFDDIADWEAYIYTNGSWEKATYNDARKFNFGQGFGIKKCVPIQMEEMRPLPSMLGLKETGVYVSGFNWFIDYMVLPLAMILFKIKRGFGRKLITSLIVRSSAVFSSKNRGVVFLLEAEGKKHNKDVKVRVEARYNDPYKFTAIPIVACLKQYFDGSINKPGLWMMGHLADPDLLLKDMKRMGVKITLKHN